MAARVVPLSVTEEALRVLYTTHADFSRLPPAGQRGRLLGGTTTTLGPYDFGQVRAQSEYLRLVSIVEASVDACSSHLFDVKRMQSKQKAGLKRVGFLLGETCGRGQRHFTSWLGHAARTFPCTNRGGRFYQPNHFSMPERHEMEYVPVGKGTKNERSGGLRLILE